MLNDCFQAKRGYTTIYLEYELCSTCRGVRMCEEIRDVFVVYNLQIVHKAYVSTHNGSQCEETKTFVHTRCCSPLLNGTSC